MLKTKQKEAIELLADGCSQVEAARRLGISPATLSSWKRNNEQFRRALAALGRSNPTELESLEQECLFAAMRELNKRLNREDIQEIDAKTLLTIIGKLLPPRTGPAARSETDVSVERSEEPLLELLSDDFRKELYELLVRRLEQTQENSSS